MWVAWVTKICLNPHIQLTGRLHVSEHGSVLERNIGQVWHGFSAKGSNKVLTVNWDSCTQTTSTWGDGIEPLQYTLPIGFDALTIFAIIPLFKMTWVSATEIRKLVLGGLNEVHQQGVHCERNCALERSRRQASSIPTVRSLPLLSVSLQLRTCRKGPTLWCCPVPLLAVISMHVGFCASSLRALPDLAWT